MENSTQPARFDTIVALAIAAVSVVSAALVGLAAFSSELATDAQRTALIASINREKADVSAHAQLFQDMRAYADFRLLDALAREVEADANAAEGRGEVDLATRLRDESQAHRAAADTTQAYFAGVYVLEDNTFDEQTFLADELQFERSINDLEPEDDIQQVQVFLNRGTALTASVAGLSVSLFFLILAQISKRKVRYVWFGVGVLLAACGAVAVMLVEVARSAGAL